jgi:hypothetical protein
VCLDSVALQGSTSEATSLQYDEGSLAMKSTQIRLASSFLLLFYASTHPRAPVLTRDTVLLYSLRECAWSHASQPVFEP